jgi:hypothetical protein
LEYLLDAAIDTAQQFAHDEEAERHLLALISPEVCETPGEYKFINAIVASPQGAGVVRVCLHTDGSVAWDTRHMRPSEIAKLAEDQLRIATERAAFLTRVIRRLNSKVRAA